MANGKIACLLGDGFEDSEFRVPYDALKKAGYTVEIIGAKAGQELKGYKGKEKVAAERSIADASPRDYQGLLIPGGQSPDHLRVDQRFVQFVRDFDRTGRPLAAVCHGPQLMMAAEIVGKGRTLTAWETVQHDLKYTGADVVDREVVVDDNWITSRKPDDLKAFSARLLEELKERERRANGEHATAP